jgi:hypothetical protein
MIRSYRVLTACALAASLAPLHGAHAQYYGSAPAAAPLYPYAVQPGQPYAVEVAPGTYVIQRPTPAARAHREEPRASSSRHASRNDPKLIEELRQRHAGKTPVKTSDAKSAKPSKVEVVNTRKVVVHKPVVIETTRVVDDPPKVVIRKRYVDDTPTASIPTRPQKNAQRTAGEVQPRDGGKQRVIEADAEVTVLGPDRMSIRLFRKGSRAQAKASAE